MFLRCSLPGREEMPRGRGTEADEGAGRDAGGQGGMLVPRERCRPPCPAPLSPWGALGAPRGYAGSRGGSPAGAPRDGSFPSPLSSRG